jgi:hypothetical protein
MWTKYGNAGFRGREPEIKAPGVVVAQRCLWLQAPPGMSASGSRSRLG